MDNGYKSKVALIIGGATGIGLTLANSFKREGCSVVIADRDIIEAKRSAKKLDLTAIQCELGRKGQVLKLLKRVYALFGRVDIVINNCRAGKRTTFLEEDERNWDLTSEVLLKASFFLAQEIARRNCGPCTMLNISSILSRVISNESASYHVAKAGLEQLTKYLAIHAGPYGIRVNSIAPGFIVKQEHLNKFNSPRNKLFKDAAIFCHSTGGIGTEQDLAEAALFLCSDKAKFINGQTLIIDGGLTLQEPFHATINFAAKAKRR